MRTTGARASRYWHILRRTATVDSPVDADLLNITPETLSPNSPRPRSRDTLATVRLLLLIALFVSAAGTLVELLLLEHVEDSWQWVPIILLGLSIIIIAWHVIGRGRASTRALQGMMWLFVASGAVGVFLHYRGNSEFELELNSSLAGFALFRESMMGATPALAPGTMVLLGIVGLIYTFRHPALRRRSATQRDSGS